MILYDIFPPSKFALYTTCDPDHLALPYLVFVPLPIGLVTTTMMMVVILSSVA